MKDQLTKYIELLFAGASDSEDIKQEILQNTLDRYDDLIAQGKTPQAAYSVAISGIGDISELLSQNSIPVPEQYVPSTKYEAGQSRKMDENTKTLLHAISTALYILCPAPLFLLGGFGNGGLGLCGLLLFVAAATLLRSICGKEITKKQRSEENTPTPQQSLRKGIRSLVRTISFVIYLAISFLTGAWEYTWIIFVMVPAIQGLITACMDLKEAQDHEA